MQKIAVVRAENDMAYVEISYREKVIVTIIPNDSSAATAQEIVDFLTSKAAMVLDVEHRDQIISDTLGKIQN